MHSHGSSLRCCAAQVLARTDEQQHTTVWDASEGVLDAKLRALPLKSVRFLSRHLPVAVVNSSHVLRALRPRLAFTQIRKMLRCSVQGNRAAKVHSTCLVNFVRARVGIYWHHSCAHIAHYIARTPCKRLRLSSGSGSNPRAASGA